MSKINEGVNSNEKKNSDELKVLQQNLQTLSDNFSKKRKERQRYGLGTMMSSSVLAFAGVFVVSLLLPSSISIDTSELSIVGIAGQFELAIVMGMAGGSASVVVVAAARSQETQNKNDALAAISFDMRQVRSDIISLRQRQLFAEGEWIKELKERVDTVDKAKEHQERK